jgi:hypothetical protein
MTMHVGGLRLLLAAAGLSAGIAALGPSQVLAHCDALDGPVVTAARLALEKNDASGLLVWVRLDDEPEVRNAFEQTLMVRKLSPQARELADKYLFETVVRLHRAGEGAPYTGLKPIGQDLGPAIPAVDRALETGAVEPLVQLLVDATEKGVRKRFAEVRARRKHAPGDVAAGRAYIAEYVPFVHYIERLYQSTTSAVHGHEPEAPALTHEE